jgi:hypothetical protein
MRAELACAGIAAAYVALLYVLSPPRLPRSHPIAIKQRTKAVLLACAVSWAPAFLLGGVSAPR